MTLTPMIFIPLVGMAVILCLPSRAHGAIRWTAVAATVPPLFYAWKLLMAFSPSAEGYQFVTLASDSRHMAAKAAEEVGIVRKTGTKIGKLPAY